MLGVFGLADTIVSQTIAVSDTSAVKLPKTKEEDFYFLNDKLDTSLLVYVAKIEAKTANAKKETVESLFQAIRNEAFKRGANAFRLLDSRISLERPDSNFLSLAVYKVGQKGIYKNHGLFPTNMVYVIGDLSYKGSDGRKMKFNDSAVVLAPLSYFAYQNHTDKMASISIGGFLGTTRSIVGYPGRLPLFYSLSGFGLGPAKRGTPGIDLNTGRINEMDTYFGSLLALILKKNS